MNNRIASATFILAAFIFFIFFFISNADSEPAVDQAREKIGSVEERRILATLQEERKKLLERGKLLDAREMELKSLQGEVDKKLNELKILKEEVQKLLAQKDEEETKKIHALGKMYEKMDPVKAAALIPHLKKDLAIGILASMKKKAAAKILNNMDSEKAVLLSKTFPYLGQ